MLILLPILIGFFFDQVQFIAWAARYKAEPKCLSTCFDADAYRINMLKKFINEYCCWPMHGLWHRLTFSLSMRFNLARLSIKWIMCFYYAVNVYVYSNYIFFGIIVPNDFFFFSLLFFFFLFPFEWNINLKIVEVKIPNGLLKHRIYLKNDQLYRYLILTWCRV